MSKGPRKVRVALTYTVELEVSDPRYDNAMIQADVHSEANRFSVSPSELRLVVDNAFRGDVVKVPAQYTTLTCGHCGSVESFDAAAKVDHTCSKCRQNWDQDDNAAENMLIAFGVLSTLPDKAGGPTPEEKKSKKALEGSRYDRAIQKRSANQRLLGLAERVLDLEKSGASDAEISAARAEFEQACAELRGPGKSKASSAQLDTTPPSSERAGDASKAARAREKGRALKSRDAADEKEANADAEE